MTETGMYAQVINEIIRPPKLAYAEYDLPLGEKIGGVYTTRTDFKVLSHDANEIICSIFHEEGKLKEERDYVVYCHTREGNRLEGLFLRHHFLPLVNVVVFDFCGCGNSKSDYVTLGIKEANDIAIVLKYLKQKFRPRNIALWGRSMGAASAIQFAQHEQNHEFVTCMALDSPFVNLNKLAEDIVKSRQYVPSFLIRCGICCVRKDLKKKTGADIGGIENNISVQLIDVPTIYISGRMDQVVQQKRVEALYKAHKCKDKEFFSIESDHASERSKIDMDHVAKFVKSRLAFPVKLSNSMINIITPTEIK